MEKISFLCKLVGMGMNKKGFKGKDVENLCLD
jgi:hypothetical protein